MDPSFPLSPIAAGLWRLNDWKMDASALSSWIEQAMAMGITCFDHADIYGGYSVEEQFGQALRRVPHLRAGMQLVTKCGIKFPTERRPHYAIKSYDSSRAHIVASVDASLTALGTDYIDVLLLHRQDALLDPNELADTFAELRRVGKVRHFGLSNHSPAQFAMVHRRLPLLTHQFEMSPLQMQALADGSLDQSVDLGLRPMIWSPLGGGRLFTSPDAQAQRLRAVLTTLAQQHGVSLATLVYAWILRHPSRPVPVTGTGRIEGLRDAVAALTLRLSAEDWYRVWQASMGHEVP